MAKPLWAMACIRARNLIREATRMIDIAQSQRCAAEIDGTRCTADKWPIHEHRVREEDRP